MRKGLTLLELVFSMVIIAITFTVVPRLIKNLASNAKTVVQEEALLNSITLMAFITNLPWDEKNIKTNAILSVNDGVVGSKSTFTCNANGYRIGGFVGGRNCSFPDTATAIPATSTTLNSIEQYNNFSLDTSYFCTSDKKLYNLVAKVKYKHDGGGAGSSHAKHIIITTEYENSYKLSKNKTKKSTGCMVFDYVAYNIGQVSIEKRRWN